MPNKQTMDIQGLFNELGIELEALFSANMNKLFQLNEDDKELIFLTDELVIGKKRIKGIRYKVNPEYDVYILTADDKGNVKENKVVELSIHFNLNGYEIDLKDEYKHIAKHKYFKFYASEDHSLVVYNLDTKAIVKLSPKLILNSIKRGKPKLALVGLKNYFNDHDSLIKINEKLVGIPAEYFDFTYVKDMTMYDISVEDTKFSNFFLSNGICVVDTVIVYALHSEEAKKEALEKMTPSSQYIDPYRNDAYIFGADKNVVFGLVIGTKEPEEVSYKPKTFKLTSKIDDLNDFMNLIRQKGASIYDYVIVNNEKMTIGQYIVQLAIEKGIREYQKSISSNTVQTK
ncbi:MAG: hypothetical protein QW251_05190 [Desulfurococcaceae archaeon]